ncbi:hypothetical protein GGI43DRAFT_431891 [Trichoderma evansii]
MDSPNPPLRLDVFQLNLTPEDPHYESGIACVRMYWKQAVLLSRQDQREMIQDIITRCYMMSKSAWAKATCHRLYRAALKHNKYNTWSAYLILNALYFTIPKNYEIKVREKFGSITIEDRLVSYIAIYPNTIQPEQADETGEHAQRFKVAYPQVKNIPYWARMGLPAPDTIIYHKIRANSIESQDTDASVDAEKQEAHLPLDFTTTNPQVPATALDVLLDITADSQDSAAVQDVTDAAAPSQDPEAKVIDLEKEPENGDPEWFLNFRRKAAAKRKDWSETSNDLDFIRPPALQRRRLTALEVERRAKDNSKRMRRDEQRLLEDVSSQQNRQKPQLPLSRDPFSPFNQIHNDTSFNTTNYPTVSSSPLHTPAIPTRRSADNSQHISSNNVASNTVISQHSSVDNRTSSRNAANHLPSSPLEVRPITSPSLASPTEASPLHLSRSSSGAHQMQQMQIILQRLEEASNAFREQEFNTFRNDFAAFRDEVRRFMAAMAASISEINRRI